MKKNIFLTALFLSLVFTMQAQTYGSSYNQVLKLIGAMDETNGPIAHVDWPWESAETPYVPVVNPAFEVEDYPGFRVVGEFGFIGIFRSETFKGIWGGASGNYNYIGVGRIDWTDKAWVQKAATPIVLEPTLAGSVVKDQQRDDLTFLKALKLSGNDFNSIQIIGHDRMTALDTVDLSNDEGGLDLFEISGCPNLKILKVTGTSVSVANNGLLFSTLAGFDVSAPTYTYAPQGTVNLTLPLNAVDLSAEFAIGTTFSNWSVAPESANNGVFVFDDNRVGQTVTVTLNNASYPALTDLQVSITLADGDYRITTAAQLDDVRNHLGGKFTLDADIDLTDYIAANYTTVGWLPIGDGTTKFKGTFDGNGHVISGLWINRPNTAFVGLFGAVGDYRYLNGTDALGATPTNSGLTAGATIKDLAIVGATISGDYNVGALAGVMGNAVVSGIYIDATVVGLDESSHGYNIGGLAGSFWGNKAQTVLQDCYTVGEVSGRREVGGIFGSTFQNEATINIKRVYSTTDVRLSLGYYLSAVGGVIGKYQSPDGLVKVTSSFAINDTIIGQEAKGSSRTGRFVGGYADGGNPKIYATDIYGLKTTKIRLYNKTGSDYENRYYDIDPEDLIAVYDASETTDARRERQKHGINKTDQQLILQSTYADLGQNAWDFSETWTMGNENYPLPILKKLPASAQPTTYPEHLKFGVSVATSAGSNGSISTHSGVKAGDNVVITVTPDADYGVDEFLVNDEDKTSELVENQYTFCIKGDATVSVTFKNILPVYTGIGAWTNTDNWSTDELPVVTDKVIIDGDVTIADHLEIASVLVNADKSVTINAGKQLTVNGIFSVDGTLNFNSDDSNGTAQLSGISDVAVAGTVQVVKTFATDTWYPVGFPFDIASISIKQSDHTYAGDIYGLDTGEEVVANPAHQNAVTTENIYLATYNGTNNKFYFADALTAAGGYLITIPSGSFTGGSLSSGTVEVTFTATAPTLNSVASTTIAEGYTLVANPNLINTTALTGTNYYYEYDLVTQHFDRVAGGSTLAVALQPFAALVTYKGSDTGGDLRSAFGIGDSDVPTNLPVINNDPIVETYYYNLQGIRTASKQPGVYIVKKIYESGKSEMSKEYKF